MEIVDFNTTIIGAGVIGLSIAAALSSVRDSILVLDKEKTFGTHTSSRNSEVIHSGIYYKENSLKSKLCIEGNKLLYSFLKKHKISYKKCGKLIVASGLEELDSLNKLEEKAKVLGLKFKRIHSNKELQKYEKSLICDEGIFIEDTGILDSHSLMLKQKQIAESNQVIIHFSLNVDSISYDGKHYMLKLKDLDYTIRTVYLINCAGLGAVNITNMLNIGSYKSFFYKGEYFSTNKIKDLKHLIYSVPPKDFKSLGIHTKNNLDGSIGFGPNSYLINKIKYDICEENKKDFINHINRYLGFNLQEKDLNPDFCGIRPKISNKNKFIDFVIKDEKENGHPKFINLLGIESPGLTCCLSIANMVKEMVILKNEKI